MSNFKQLVERMRSIDPAAADYLEGDDIRHIKLGVSECGFLSGVMVWANTPQGHNYWSDIFDQLDGGNMSYVDPKDQIHAHRHDPTGRTVPISVEEEPMPLFDTIVIGICLLVLALWVVL